jgi:2-aminoadipate transaminase
VKKFDFGSGRPDPASFPVQGLVEAAIHAIPKIGGDFVLYPGDKGHLGLREVMAARESRREGVDVSPDDIALMTGSMQAVTLMAEAFMEQRGDVILTEEFTYSGTIGAYKKLGAELVGVPLDGDGMRPDLLEETIQRLIAEGRRPKFIYTLATYQNPTGSVMPLDRRREILRIANRHGVILVEDNCYGDVKFEGEHVPAFYTLDGAENVLYICSLSKVLAPGVRLGYLLARPAMMRRALDRRYDGGNSVLAACIVGEYFRENMWDHIGKVCRIIREKRDTLFSSLEKHLGDIATWSHPVGGLFLWLKLPEATDMDRLQQLAGERGVVFARGRGFHVYGQDVKYIRLAFGYPGLEEIREGVKVLAQCVREAQRIDNPMQA